MHQSKGFKKSLKLVKTANIKININHFCNNVTISFFGQSLLRYSENDTERRIDLQ